MGFVIAVQFSCNKKRVQNIWARYTLLDRSAKRRWDGRRKERSDSERRRLMMLLMLGRSKTTSELAFNWSTFLVLICHEQLLDDDYIHAGDIFSLVA